MKVLALIFLIPLAGAAVNGIFWKRLKGNVPGLLASSTVFASFALALWALFELSGLDVDARVIQFSLYEWIGVGDFIVPLGFRFDPLSMTWTLIVTGVGFLIHVYAIGYMSHEDDYSRSRFFCYMNLFIFAMLILVMADSLVLLFLGWEGVGLCSYLLIAYYYDLDFAAAAGKKAFIVNRIGDVGFLLAIFMIFVYLKDVRYDGMFEALAESPPAQGVITAIAILLFVGAVGKSAQIPLYVWLPDAMAGPTPVSALIHAATMVTAGVYMVCRMSPLFAMSTTAMAVVAVTGCLTALFAGIIGILQRDIKKVLAYSTVSQLGYMFMACGVGAFTAGVFHVTTHAFFKALLFLGAGSVIHAMTGEQDIFRMGALNKKLKGVFIAFSAGALALAGVIPFAGFFSKDEILWETFSAGGFSYILWGLGVLTAGITAFYTFRLVYVTFLGWSRVEPEKAEHIHPPPLSMNWPVYTLAALSVLGGLIGIPAVLGHMVHIPNVLGDFLEPTFRAAHQTMAARHAAEGGSHALEIGLMVFSLLVVGAGMVAAWRIYRKGMGRAVSMAKTMERAHRVVFNKFYVDETYDRFIVAPLKRSTSVFYRFDLRIIDGLVNLTGRIVEFFGIVVRVTQTGVVHTYAFWFILGALVLLIMVL